MATSQPIALPASSQHNNDYTMGSYSGSSSGPFNPASYTRHFLGSPISWRAGSFGARFPQGSPSATLFSSLDRSKGSSFDELSVMNAFNVFDREGELCRDYNCCGIHLPDLHALLEHFEEVHVLVVDPNAPNAHIAVPFNPQPLDGSNPHQQHRLPPSLSQPPSHVPFDSDDMELELDLDNSTHPPPPPLHHSSTHSSPSSGAPSPPHTPNNTTLTHFAHQYPQFQHHTPFTSAHTSPYTSQPPSPGSTSSNPANPNPHLNVQSVGVHFPNAGPGTPTVMTHPEEAFNAYARFAADYSSHMPGTQFNASGGEEIVVNGVGVGEYGGGYVGQMPPGVAPAGGPQGQQCIPPALLFASTSTSSSSSPPNTNGDGARMDTSNNSTKLKLKVRGSGAASSTPSTPSTTTPSATPFGANTTVSTTTTSTAASTPISTPTHTPSHTPLPTGHSLLLSKPFRCPKPNCNKSYKQANGLKYHMTHGSCNFAPPKDLEHVKDLLERKRREREQAAATNGGPAALSRSASLGSRPAGAETGEQSFVYGDLGSITETELREVEREAEKRVRPFACGVGDCQRRYKNMNGLRYHYQHSGDHGAVGLALLAGGLHECLGNNAGGEGKGKGKNGVNASSTAAGAGGSAGGVGTAEEREGRRRAAAAAAPPAGGGVHRTAASGVRGGSASVPVSRATSVSRVGTPVPQQNMGYPTGTTATTPFTPGYTNPGAVTAATGNAQQQGAGDGSSPPLTPLTAAVQGLGLGIGQGVQGGVRSQPHSPTHPGQGTFQAQQQQAHSQSPSPHMQHQQQHSQQQQQQLAYQAQFAELQRRQYMAMQAQQQQFHHQQQQQQHYQHQQHQQSQQQPQPQQHYNAQGQLHLAEADAQAQQEFVEAQRREFELQQQQQRGDSAMA
ncbi:putative zinc finger [Lyophyllum shimeji]|uniref:Zinc finger n=1 Tax=Lyophyllum shimeji TaxID=47721 RepID=A0A9P3PWS6_LYOSH|nr:putative zinc finger [Lyophyllum shimeji]